MESCQSCKNQCAIDLPLNLPVGGIPVAPGDVASSFGNYFSNKVNVNACSMLSAAYPILTISQDGPELTSHET